ncbi:lytic transglycosylase domain-containing protein [Candidatus Peregrinibacteria bacterium]|nr:lytic transglycosylase domain-containing protein [Candidatus Peregrinibacteria bacterium]
MTATLSTCDTIHPQRSTEATSSPQADPSANNLFKCLKNCWGVVINGGTELFIKKTAIEHGVDPVLVKAVIVAESACDPKAVSPKNAQGLMQLNPRFHRLKDPHNPQDNIRKGVAELARLLKKYGGDQNLALAAYNAGEGNVDTYNGVPPFSETQAYIAKVLMYRGLFSIL